MQLEDGSLELAESGWSVSSDGYVNYVLALRNTSSTVAVNLPGTLIAGYAEDGSIAFSQEQYLSVIQPGETFWFAAMAANATVPASVEFSLIEPEDYQIVQASAEDAARFEVSNTSEVEGSYGTTSFTGEVTTLAEGNDYYSMDMVVVSVILRDGSGAIVSGAQTFVSRPGEGASTSFEVRANNVPDYASYEIYAQVW